jgi:hypothetical protein
MWSVLHGGGVEDDANVRARTESLVGPPYIGYSAIITKLLSVAVAVSGFPRVFLSL